MTSAAIGQSGVQRYIWDEVNRLKSLCGTSEGARYEYRADGMRVKKITGLTIEWVGDEYSASGYYDENLNQDLPTVRYFYDGQMPMEEDSTYKENSVSVRDYTQYGLGARGIDYIRNVHHSSGEAVVFPIYDGHGNMVYTLSRGGNDTFSLGNKRIYGAWGDLRHDGNPGDGPNTQYCANLGHKKDNESGLTYMRARYYEPWTGRFVSQDIAKDGRNWFIYASNNPVLHTDSTGLFVDVLISCLIEDFLQAGNAIAQLAAKRWGEHKIKMAMSYHMGKITGWLAASSIDDLTFGLTDLGFFITNQTNGRRIHVRFDLGKISFQPQPSGRGAKTPYSYFDEFLRGMTEGFNDAF